VHLLRNAVDHGLELPAARLLAGKPEVGRIEIEARRERDMIQIAVRDDGAGIDLDAVRRGAVEAGLLPQHVAEDLPPDQVADRHAGLSTAAVSESPAAASAWACVTTSAQRHRRGSQSAGAARPPARCRSRPPFSAC
jgi:two-component system chemotaxis sensor kinase CheA